MKIKKTYLAAEKNGTIGFRYEVPYRPSTPTEPATGQTIPISIDGVSIGLSLHEKPENGLVRLTAEAWIASCTPRQQRKVHSYVEKQLRAWITQRGHYARN